MIGDEPENTIKLQAVLKAQINKTDRNDARGIAQMMRAGLYRPVHVKTIRSQKLRMLLTHRKLLQSKAIAIENDLRGTLRNFGLKVGMVGKVKFEARIGELVENLPDLAVLVEPMLIVRRTLREQIVVLHRRLLAIVRDDEVCRRLMTTPGVGPVVALTYRATVDVPARFRKSKAVGAVFGLTCAKYQSGEVDRNGRISRCGDEMMRVMLYEAAQSMLRSKKWSWLKAWAMQIARRRGMKKAIVALARRLAVIMHRIWVTAVFDALNARRSMHVSQLNTGINGGGGLAAAIAVRQAGHDVTVFEQVELVKRVGADINLTPNVVAQCKSGTYARAYVRARRHSHLEGAFVRQKFCSTCLRRRASVERKDRLYCLRSL